MTAPEFVEREGAFLYCDFWHLKVGSETMSVQVHYFADSVHRGYCPLIDDHNYIQSLYPSTKNIQRVGHAAVLGIP